jgi:hypothetical protein
MKRALLSIALLLACAAAHAENITLLPSTCGLNRYCLAVASDSAHEILIYATPALPAVHVLIDGVPYDAASGNSNLITALVLTNADTGAQIVLSCAFTGTRRYIGSGRGQHWVTAWTLSGGLIQTGD